MTRITMSEDTGTSAGHLFAANHHHKEEGHQAHLASFAWISSSSGSINLTEFHRVRQWYGEVCVMRAHGDNITMHQMNWMSRVTSGLCTFKVCRWRWKVLRWRVEKNLRRRSTYHRPGASSNASPGTSVIFAGSGLIPSKAVHISFGSVLCLLIAQRRFK